MSKRMMSEWTIADLRALPEDCKVEVLDGAPLVRSGPLPVQQRTRRRLAAAVEGQLPASWQLETAVPVLLCEAPLDFLCPAITVFGASVPLSSRYVAGSDVLLVVELSACAESIAAAYGRAGIPNFWRVEDGAVHTYALEDGRYVTTGAFRDRLVSMGLDLALDFLT